MADENDAPETVDPVDETKTQIQELKDGLMEIATQVGRLKGELKAHKERPDAHHPAMLGKDVN